MPAESNILAVPKDAEKAFARGFKTWCENTAVSVRKRMELKDYEPLSPSELAKNMGVTIMELESIPGLDQHVIDHLSSQDGDEWSAVTVHVKERHTIILNPRHSLGRKNSDLMHELAHIVRQHSASKVFVYDSYAIRSFDVMQENEANWLAATMLLPRPALVRLTYNEVDPQDAIEDYGVTKSLFNYRINITGVRRQHQRSKF